MALLFLRSDFGFCGFGVALGRIDGAVLVDDHDQLSQAGGRLHLAAQLAVEVGLRLVEGGILVDGLADLVGGGDF